MTWNYHHESIQHFGAAEYIAEQVMVGNLSAGHHETHGCVTIYMYHYII